MEQPLNTMIEGTKKTTERITTLFVAVLTSMRPHHWAKNVLLAVPLVMAHQWNEPGAVRNLLIAIGTFSLVVSAVYIINDVLDLPADRAHPLKKERPIAKGDVPIPLALLSALLLAAMGFIGAAAFLNHEYLGILFVYAVAALAYSAWFKHCLVLDVVVLANLYGLRIFAGGAVVGVQVSAWLLAFSGFFFLSLAFAKRYLDLAVSIKKNEAAVTENRPYTVADLEIFRVSGPTCGLLSVLVLALYINSSAVQTLYEQPQILWFLCPLFLYWILRTWVLVLRGETSSDPVVFALRDKASLVVVILTVVILFLAI